MKFQSYPVIDDLHRNDTFMVHQWETASEKLITASNAAISLGRMRVGVKVNELKAIDTTKLSLGSVQFLDGYTSIGDPGAGFVIYFPSATDTPNDGTIFLPNSGVGRWKRPATGALNVQWFGAKGDDSTNDLAAIQGALDAAGALGDASVYFPAGVYKIVGELNVPDAPAVNISIIGDGPNVSVIKQYDNGAANALSLEFAEVGSAQPNRATIKGIGFRTSGNSNRALSVVFNTVAVIQNHRNPALVIENVNVESEDDSNSWANGIYVQNACNVQMTNVFCSGSSKSGVYANMVGAGVYFAGFCVNSQLANVQCTFWKYGFRYTALGNTVNDVNTEGLFMTNCSMSQVIHAVSVEGNGNATVPRVTGFTWSGGLAEIRANGPAFVLQNVWAFSVTGCYMISADAPSGTTYAMVLDGCGTPSGTPVWGAQPGGTVSGNTFYAFDEGVRCVNTNHGISVMGNVFHGVNIQVRFGAATTESVSGQNILSSNDPYEINDNGEYNRIYVGMDYGAYVTLNGNKTTNNGLDYTVEWGQVYDNDTVGGVQIFDNTNATTRTRLNIPPGVTQVRLSCGIRWDATEKSAGSFVNGQLYVITDIGTTDFTLIGAASNSLGLTFIATGAGAGSGKAAPLSGRWIKVLDNNNNPWLSSDYMAFLRGDTTVSSITVPVDPTMTYFYVKVNQTSNGSLDIRDVDGTFFSMEIIQ